MQEYIVKDHEPSLLPDESAYKALSENDKFIVDYVRVFDEID